MARGDNRRRADARYFLTFVGTAGLLLSGTLVLVLYVLPERYVLSSGFVEGNLNLPDPSIPFEAVESRFVAARPMSAPPDTAVVRGPAERFWEEVLPLIAAEEWDAAIGLFALYLGSNPTDDGARREYAITLAKAGYADRAIPLFERLLGSGDDPELRLLLARTLRDAGRVADASVHYRVLIAGAPTDESLVLEHAGALAWIEAYPEAIDIIEGGLRVVPLSVLLRAELGRLQYLAGQLVAAERTLGELSASERAEAGATELYRTIVGELTPPEVEPIPAPEPTVLERAVGAREEGRFEEADSLFLVAIGAQPDRPDLWQAYADFLQYERQDLPGALGALKEVVRLQGETGPGAAALQYRMAQLEVWTDDLDAAELRLVRLTASIDPEASTVELGDALALRGDIARWRGDRPAAARRYDEALTVDPLHVSALAGAEALREDVSRVLVENEQPGLGGIARSFSDTDDFHRLDLGGEWRGIDGSWVWATTSGARLMRGFDLASASADRDGLFAELEGGRWWRSGTVRTVARLGAQTVRDGATDLSVGLGARFGGAAGQRTDVDLDSEPAHLSANTLQSSEADVRQDRLAVSHTRALGPVWSMAVSGEAASLSHRGVTGSDRNLRAAGSAALARSVGGGFSAGARARALSYSSSAPTSVGRGLYWDPEWSLSVGPLLRWEDRVSSTWRLEASASPGVGMMRERTGAETQVVPDINASFRALREGARYRTSVDVTYGQGRFTGYRSLTIGVGFAAHGWTGTGR